MTNPKEDEDIDNFLSEIQDMQEKTDLDAAQATHATEVKEIVSQKHGVVSAESKGSMETPKRFSIGTEDVEPSMGTTIGPVIPPGIVTMDPVLLSETTAPSKLFEMATKNVIQPRDAGNVIGPSIPPQYLHSRKRPSQSTTENPRKYIRLQENTMHPSSFTQSKSSSSTIVNRKTAPTSTTTNQSHISRTSQDIFNKQKDSTKNTTIKSTKGNASKHSKSSEKTDTQPTVVKRSFGGETWEDKTLVEWPENDFRIFVGNLAPEVTDEDLQEAFSQFSSLAKVHVAINRKTGESKGYGFASFLDPQDYVNALDTMHGEYIKSRMVQLKPSKWKQRSQV